MARKRQEQQDTAVEDFTLEEMFSGSDTGDVELDLSEISEQPRIEALPAGIYNAHIESVEFSFSQRSNNPMLTWTFRVKTPDGRERTQFYHTVLTESGIHRLKRLLVRLQPYAQQEFDIAKFKPANASEIFIGTPCRVRLRIQPYEGQQRNSVSDVLPPDESELSFV